MKLKINISKGNSKIGQIPNVSLVPVKDCANCKECKKDCYALKAWRMYPSVRKSWSANSKAFRADIMAALIQVDEYLQKHNPRFFRWHVAGDILSQEHFNGINLIARQNPATKFLIFTKRHDLEYANIAKNLTVIFSMFPGMDNPAGNLPKAWVQDGAETRIPKTARECPGLCHNCGMCWGIKHDVYFMKH